MPIPDELPRRLKDAALVRSAAERQLEAGENSLTAYELAEIAGLIGVVKGAIRDLSTNPKYFDGFGGS